MAAPLLLGALVLVALALRLPSFSGALWGDELATNFVVHGFGVADFGWLLTHGKEATPPLFFVLAWLTKGLGGPEGLRLVSLLAGLASIPMTYLVGLETVGRRAGAVGAALVALSPFQIFYSTEARAYELLMLTCLLATYALLRAIATRRTAWWVGYGVSVAVAMYTHYVAVFILIGLFIWAFWAHPEVRRPVLAANAGATLLFAAWIPEFIDATGKQAAKNIELLHPLTLDHAVTDLLRMWFGQPLLELADLPGRVALALSAVALVLGTLGLLLRASREGRWWPPPGGVALVIALALATPLGVVLHNVVAPSIFTPRNLIPSWPGFALALGALVTAGTVPIRTAATALLIAGYGIGAAQMLEGDNRRGDYEAVASFIERTGDPGSPVVDLPQFAPGPQMSMEAALAPDDEATPGDRSVYELGLPPLQQRLEDARNGVSFSEAGPPAPPRRIAAAAAAMAGDGTLFVVGPAARLDQVRALPGPLGAFLAALPPRFHEVQSRTFEGPSIFGIGVFVLSGEPAPRP